MEAEAEAWTSVEFRCKVQSLYFFACRDCLVGNLELGTWKAGLLLLLLYAGWSCPVDGILGSCLMGWWGWQRDIVCYSTKLR